MDPETWWDEAADAGAADADAAQDVTPMPATMAMTAIARAIILRITTLLAMIRADFVEYAIAGGTHISWTLRIGFRQIARFPNSRTGSNLPDTF